MRKLNYADLQHQITKCGYHLLTLENEYASAREPITVVCKCGGKITTTLSNLRRMKGCKQCTSNKKKTYREIEAIFQARHCVLLTTEAEYTNSRHKIHYRCSCGTDTMITPHAFLAGQSCFNCGRRKRSGQNHRNFRKGHLFRGSNNPNWNAALTDEERDLRKHRGDHCYKEWRRAVYERDNFTCQKCKKRGGDLNVHHIENFSACPHLRYEVDNGITFCEACHTNFHKRYGKYNNHLGQVQEFYSDLYLD